MASKKPPKKKPIAAAATPQDSPLLQLRAQIDGVDAKIHALLNERAGLARQAGISKHADGHTVDFYRPEREAQVLRMARERNKGPLRTEEILRLFREILPPCSAKKGPPRSGYFGPKGRFSRPRPFKIFANSCPRSRLPPVDRGFQEVKAGLA